MAERNEERRLTEAFDGFRASATPQLRGGRGAAEVRRVVRRRRVVHRSVGVFATLAAVVLGGFALGRTGPPGPTPLPESSDIASSAAPTASPPAASTQASTPASTPTAAPKTSDASPRQTVDLAVSASYPQLVGGSGSMIVRVANAGQTTVSGFRLTVTTPPGIHVTGARGCTVEADRTPFRCAGGQVKPGDSVNVNLTMTADAGAGQGSASQRTVSVQPVGAVDASGDNDTSTYQIKLA